MISVVFSFPAIAKIADTLCFLFYFRSPEISHSWTTSWEAAS